LYTIQIRAGGGTDTESDHTHEMGATGRSTTRETLVAGDLRDCSDGHAFAALTDEARIQIARRCYASHPAPLSPGLVHGDRRSCLTERDASGFEIM
jgi:hypothetical protein